MEQSQEARARHFVILTQEILEDERLTLAEKIILARISGFEEFYEAAEETAEKLKISADKVRKAKQHLAKLGFIIELENTGRGKRYIASFLEARLVKLTNQTGQINQSDWAKNTTEYKESIKRELKEKQTKEKDPDQPKTYGNAEVNAMLEAWAEATGFDYKNQKNERYAISGLIRQHGPERMRALLRLVSMARRSRDRFAPQIAKPSQLRGKYSKLEALTMWAEKREAEAKATGPSPALYRTPEWIHDEAPDQDLTQAERHEIAEKHRATLVAKLEGKR